MHSLYISHFSAQKRISSEVDHFTVSYVQKLTRVPFFPNWITLKSWLNAVPQCLWWALVAQHGQKMGKKWYQKLQNQIFVTQKLRVCPWHCVCECVDEWMIDWVGVRTVKQFPRIEDQHFREFVISDTFFRESVNSSKIFPLPRLGRLEISEVALRRVKRLRKFVVLTICSRQRHQISSGSLTFCFVELGQKSFMQRKTTVWKSEKTVFSLEVIWLSLSEFTSWPPLPLQISERYFWEPIL